MLAGRVEPEAGTANVAVVASHEPTEAGEQATHVLGRDADAALADGGPRPALAVGQAALDLAALGRVFDGVVEELVQHRRDAGAITEQPETPGWGVVLDQVI